MPSESETWNRYLELTDLMHTAPTEAERREAKRARLAMLLNATTRMTPGVNVRR
jgi:hypothetical protein